MLAQDIFDNAPLGARIAFSDGSPRPPDRFRKKLSSWENDNGSGRLTSKSGVSRLGGFVSTESFALHLADYGGDGVIFMVVTRHYAVNSAFTFEILDRPKPGMVRVLKRWREDVELLHLAADRLAAERWIAERFMMPFSLKGLSVVFAP
jgi:hypothetical protein